MGERVDIDAWGLLTVAQRVVVDTVLRRESEKRTHVVVALSGAHAYGFPSPDSDVDMKAIHCERTERVLGLRPYATTADKLEVIDGVEIDYTSNELGLCLAGTLKGNGNFLERVLGGVSLQTSPWLEGLKPVVRGVLSQRFHRHYRGFATSQRGEFEKSPTAKRLLYVLRTTLTGTHLLRTGELVVNLTELIDEYGFGAALELIEAKRAGERSALSDGARERWVGEVDRMFAVLDAACETSVLPKEPDGEDSLDAWLIATRRAMG